MSHKVLIVEDSPVAQEFLVHILTSDPAIHVVGIANNGEEALAAVKDKRPDVITMDIHMPKIDGFEATRAIMASLPTPIVIVSASTAATEVASTFRAVEAGALAVILRPPGIGHPEHEAAARELIQTVKLMSEVKVVRRFSRPAGAGLVAPLPIAPSPILPTGIRVAAMGASTGGPLALQKILSRLPQDLPFPVLIVQHIALGFAAGFAAWLAGSSRLKVRLAAAGEPMTAGHAYVAPDGLHLGVQDSRRIELSRNAPENGVRPSVSYLFRSIAKIFGRKAAGVLEQALPSAPDDAARVAIRKDLLRLIA